MRRFFLMIVVILLVLGTFNAENEKPFEGRIALLDIESVQWEKINMAGTVLIIIGAAVAIFTVFALLAVGKSYDEI